jgi:aminoglycoside N3'-acetyltransferase
MQPIQPEHTKEILAEMCKRVGVDAETFDFHHEDWYHLHEWTLKEEEDFTQWLANYLRKHKYTRGKKRGLDASLYEAQKIVAFYGWRLKDGKE